MLIIRYNHLHNRFTGDHPDITPQKFHTLAVPRIGGISVMLGGLISTGFMSLKGNPLLNEFSILLICSLPAFFSGLLEDITKRVGVVTRLLLTMVAAVMGFFILEGELTRLSLPFVDKWLSFMPLSLALTIVAVAGVSHAINIIDGYNGLAGVVSALILVALAYVSYKVGDSFLLAACVSAIGAVLGFLVWNYPNGLIFLGDGGAYLLGFIIAEVSILLVNRHQEVSPWFPMLLVVYPVWETIFSIYRKKFIRGQSPGLPDGLHFHMMVYKRLLQWAIGRKEAKQLLHRNAMTSPYLWGLSLFAVIPAVLFWRHTIALACFIVIFIALYLWLYWKIVRFKTPKWLIRREKENR